MRIVDMMDQYNIGYGSVNHNRNRCMDCGYENASPNLKKCPKCGQSLPPQAHFCFICGTKILTQRESIIENLVRTRDSIALIPSNASDAFISAVNGAISYLEGLPDE